MKVLVVGAGFAGSVYARECAEAGHHVTLIDRRAHPGGLAFDEVVGGVRLHRYGAHLFNTGNRRVVDWLGRFTEWVPYAHKAKSRLDDGTLVPFPLNLNSLDILAARGIRTAFEDSGPAAAPAPNARAWLRTRLNDELIDLFFERYVAKMWGMSLDELSADVVRRVNVRANRDDRYFGGKAFQALPRHGYAALFRRMLDHPNIALCLGQPFETQMMKDADVVFSSASIDTYFDFRLGALGFRSMRFHTSVEPEDRSAGCGTVNLPDDTPFTRESHWRWIGPNGRAAEGYLVTREEPCAAEDNAEERYYPIQRADGRDQKLHARYAALVKEEAGRIQFIGRCGTYRYLNIDQVVM